MLDEAKEWNHGPSNKVVNFFLHNAIIHQLQTEQRENQGHDNNKGWAKEKKQGLNNSQGWEKEKIKGRIITKGGKKRKPRA